MQKSPLQDATQWADFLVAQELPSLSPARARIATAMADDNPSAVKLAEQIRQDPVLSARLLMAANKAFATRGDSVRSLTKAINVLGLGQTQQIFNALPYKPERAAEPQYRLYSLALSVSLLAARFAHAMSPQHQPAQAEEIAWCSLLAGVPFWYLFCHGSERVHQLADPTPRIMPSVAEVEALGTSFRSIAEACLEQLQLPDLSKRALPQQDFRYRRLLTGLLRQARTGNLVQAPDIEDRELKEFLHRPERIVSLANILAWEAMADWYAPRTIKAQYLAALAARAALPNWMAYSHNLAADTSRQHRFANVHSAGARLIMAEPYAPLAPGREAVAKAPAKKVASAPTLADADSSAAVAAVTPPQEDVNPAEALPAAVPEPPPEAAAKATDAAPRETSLFDEVLQSMLQTPERFADTAQLMNTAVRTLCFGIGLDRAVAALINKPRTRLKGLYAAGTGNSPELARFEVDLEKPSLFSKLLEKSAAVWIKPSSSAKLLESVPAAFRQVAQREEFLLMSTFMRDRPVAVLYGDLADGVQPQQYDQFKLLCQAVSFVLRHMSERGQTSTP